MKLLLMATLLWGPSLYAKVTVPPPTASTAEVIYPNTPDPERTNPAVNPVPESMDSKNIDQTLRAPKDRNPSSQRQEEKEHKDHKPKTSRPIGPNKW